MADNVIWAGRDDLSESILGPRGRHRASNCRIACRRLATPLLVSNKKKSSASLKALAADSQQGLAAYGGTVAAHQRCLYTGLSGRSHLSQSRAADGHAGAGDLSGLGEAHAGTENESGRTQRGSRSLRGENS